jgi:hypothetical protein
MKKKPLLDPQKIAIPLERLTKMEEANLMDMMEYYPAFKECADQEGIPIPYLESMITICLEEKKLTKGQKTRLRRKVALKEADGPNRMTRRGGGRR